MLQTYIRYNCLPEQQVEQSMFQPFHQLLRAMDLYPNIFSETPDDQMPKKVNMQTSKNVHCNVW